MALKGVWRRTTALDKLLVAAVALLCLASFGLWRGTSRGERVVVMQGERTLFTAPLNVSRTVRLPGPLGETLLAIKDGRVCVLDSPCPQKVCIGMGEVSRSGELVACVPNRLIIRIEGGAAEGEDYDLLSR